MNIVTEEDSLGLVHFNLDQDAEKFIPIINRVKGVSKAYCLTDRYELSVRIGKAFDKESVILNIKVELIKHSD